MCTPYNYNAQSHTSVYMSHAHVDHTYMYVHIQLHYSDVCIQKVLGSSTHIIIILVGNTYIHVHILVRLPLPLLSLHM